MSIKNSRLEKKHRKRRRIKRWVLVLLSFVMLLTLFGGYVIYKSTLAANHSFEELERGNKSKLRETAVNIHKDPFSLLILGVEDYSSGGHGGRADTLMVATINPDDKSINLLSIPRDTQVEIPETGEIDKINHSYNYGKEATIETVENFLDIPIDYYATVNFDAFKNIVDVLDGITVNVPFDFYQNSDDRVAEKLYFYEGEMELDGRYALAYARMRKQDPTGDFGRNERQKEVVKAVIDKALSPSTIFKIDDLTKEIGNNVETNIRPAEAIKMSKVFAGFDSSKISTVKLEGEDSTINNIYYFLPSEESVASIQEDLKYHLDTHIQDQAFKNE
ncbi:LCP family protein [Cytobacillus firmus]|uniref:LCP family protein n=1 Tax=Cytobacillus firmus TaxID=1399 RepID=UPI00385052E8